MKLTKIKITFTNGIEASEVVWQIVEHKFNLHLLTTEFGNFWAQNQSYLYNDEGELVIDVTNSDCEKFEGLLKWIDYQALNTNNLYVHVEAIVDPDVKFMGSDKTGKFKYNYMQRNWCDETNSWVLDGIRERLSQLPKSQIQLLTCGKRVAPIWLISKFLPNCFSKNIDCVRLVKKSDLINLMHLHRNKLIIARSR